MRTRIPGSSTLLTKSARPSALHEIGTSPSARPWTSRAGDPLRLADAFEELARSGATERDLGERVVRAEPQCHRAGGRDGEDARPLRKAERSRFGAAEPTGVELERPPVPGHPEDDGLAVGSEPRV